MTAVDVLAWIANGVAVWVAASLYVFVVVGRVVRARDRQIPTD